MIRDTEIQTTVIKSRKYRFVAILAAMFLSISICGIGLFVSISSSIYPYAKISGFPEIEIGRAFYTVFEIKFKSTDQVSDVLHWYWINRPDIPINAYQKKTIVDNAILRITSSTDIDIDTNDQGLTQMEYRYTYQYHFFP